jgi:transposase
METVANRQPCPRRSYSPEFKAEIVERCQDGDRTIGQVARDFDLVESAVRRWVEELIRLRRENAR